jgi:hypothetical protein
MHRRRLTFDPKILVLVSDLLPSGDRSMIQPSSQVRRRYSLMPANARPSVEVTVPQQRAWPGVVPGGPGGTAGPMALGGVLARHRVSQRPARRDRASRTGIRAPFAGIPRPVFPYYLQRPMAQRPG